MVVSGGFPPERVNERGGTLTMTLVFVTMFSVIFISLAGIVNQTFHQSVLQAQDETAFQVAESGLNYARWRLAHDPDDLSGETKTLTDPFAGDLGTYDVSFTAPTGGEAHTIVTSVGRTVNQPAREVTLSARYGQPSLARFASITNSDVWYGGTISGPVHSNGGIRMTGDSDSTMSSAKETYACQPQHGCGSPFETKPGVWGTGTTQELWEYPVPAIDYNAITLDLLDMKTAAQASSTYYGSSNRNGYEIEFNADNTYSIYIVRQTANNVWSAMYEPTWTWSRLKLDVGTRDFVETKAIPSNGVIFVEDDLWISGEIRDRVSVAAGRFPDNPATNVDIILNGNISYNDVKDGSRAFAAVAQRHVLIPWAGTPDTMSLDGAFVAQKGSFHRRYYPNCCGSQTHRLKTSLNRYGMIASNGVPATAWVSGGDVVSGFQQGESTYDPNFFYQPPPYFPGEGQLEFITWEELQ